MSQRHLSKDVLKIVSCCFSHQNNLTLFYIQAIVIQSLIQMMRNQSISLTYNRHIQVITRQAIILHRAIAHTQFIIIHSLITIEKSQCSFSQYIFLWFTRLIVIIKETRPNQIHCLL
ncbi:hypothetical protein DW026_08660 [Segatella copri]|uniref:Uncharacterized protein n=1 Tax=Segatella copri TaxID=165179 RepID=A0AA92VC19_9BACT|nr:hypothetical protein DW026_08660 [Segatella copri]